MAETALFALVGVLILALAVALDEEWKGTLAAGLVLAAVALTRGWLPAGLLTLAAAAFLAGQGSHRGLRVAVMLALAIGGFALWPRDRAPAASRGPPSTWTRLTQWNVEQVRGPNSKALSG